MGSHNSRAQGTHNQCTKVEFDAIYVDKDALLRHIFKVEWVDQLFTEWISFKVYVGCGEKFGILVKDTTIEWKENSLVHIDRGANLAEFEAQVGIQFTRETAQKIADVILRWNTMVRYSAEANSKHFVEDFLSSVLTTDINTLIRPSDAKPILQETHESLTTSNERP